MANDLTMSAKMRALVSHVGSWRFMRSNAHALRSNYGDNRFDNKVPTNADQNFLDSKRYSRKKHEI